MTDTRILRYNLAQLFRGTMRKTLLISLIVITSSLFATRNAQEAYLATTQAMNNEKWDEAIFISEKLIHTDSSLAKEALFLRATAYLELGDYSQANKAFTKYLKQESDSKYFLEVLEKKFLIAEAYRGGKRKRLFGFNKTPPISSGTADALAIYDEVIHSMPHQDIAAKSLYSKGLLLQKKKEFKESNDALKELITSFPNHHLSCEAFVKIQWNYAHLASSLTQDSDLLEIARLNLERFKKAFPGEKKKIAQAKEAWNHMQSIYAKGLYDIARFYERTKKPKAAALYYQKILQAYGMTKWAGEANRRMLQLEKKDLHHSAS